MITEKTFWANVVIGILIVCLGFFLRLLHAGLLMDYQIGGSIMDAKTLQLVVIFGALVVVAIVCGIGSAKAGGGFFWGACFGPVGIVVAAILADGDRTRKYIQVATDSMLKQAKAPTPRSHQAPTLPPAKPITVKCAYCGNDVCDIPGPGTYECPSCGKYIDVKSVA